ncbi:hypothetical protein PCC7424_0517 [Gloeothece citriformis PCC 7424]|uniref:Uncharacterized protein n=1 Tax=Gloeothece citriformis (strain PCC 7424) TaxID=65393 RepID=B7KDG1_GLOC7|nr:hypothetical protein [Gloeothece citriformis]ACK68981.1 hypothetical protein PCC7424_0517 [Gloeothece citriformis PCC 7424]
MKNHSATEAQLSLNLSLTEFVLAEKLTTRLVKQFLCLLSCQELSETKIRKLGKNSKLRIPCSSGWLSVSPSKPEREGRRYLWNISLIPSSIV